jgi:hypothetical protein
MSARTTARRWSDIANYQPDLRQRVRVRHRDPEIHPAAERPLKRSRDPVATHACLFEHQVRGTERDVREAFLRARVGDLEAAQVAPEIDALVQIGHEQFGNEHGFEGFSHRTIVAGLTLRAVPVTDRLSGRGARRDEDAEGVPRRVSKDDEGFGGFGGSVRQDCRSKA